MRWGSLICTLTMLLALATNASGGFVIIDDFSTPNPATPAGRFRILPPGGGPNPEVLVFPSGFGSTRTLTAQVDSTPVTNSLTGQVGYDSLYSRGTLRFNSDNAARAHVDLHYDNLSPFMSNWFSTGIPLYLYIDFINIDPGLDITPGSPTNGGPAPDFPVNIAISTTGGTMSATFYLTQTAIPVSYQIPLSIFSGPPTVDLTQVTSIDFSFNSGVDQRQATDFIMSQITLGTLSVPGPPAAVLALLGIPVLAAIRRFRR